MSDATGPGAAQDAVATPSTPTPEEELHALSVQANEDVQSMSYETARDALVRVVDQLERGGTSLEESLALWERGEALAARCESWLVGARARLDAARAAAQPRPGG